MQLIRNTALAILALSLCMGRLMAQDIPSFPGALGYGNQATGGWALSGTNHTGGTVYHVTNLNDSGAGSFRTGVGTSGNIVVFDVGGDIQALTPISAASNISIEGQTAPGGIQIFGAEVSFFGQSNIICRYMHFRDGTLDPNYPGSSATNSSTNAANLGDTTNVIMDHCTFEFAAYNNIDAGGTGAVNSTIQYCIFADPILEQQFNFHLQGGPTTMIGNLMANSGGRNPLGKANLQFVNNIVYNWGFAMTTGNSSGTFDWDVINNYFITGPNTTDNNDDYYQVDSGELAYATGNYEDTSENGTLQGNTANTVGGATVETSPWSATTATLPTVTAQAAFYDVLSNAGPVPRDQVDSQVVTQTLSLGTQGRRFNTQTDTGLGNDGYGTITGGAALPDSDGAGMPDDWKAAEGLNLTNPAISGSTSSTGYTYLENYLAWKALPNTWVAKNTTALPTSVTIDLSQYTNGFAAGSTFTLSGTVNGTVTPMTGTQSSSNDFIVTFTPKLNTSGTGGFNWSVTNGITTMSSTFGVLISQSGPSQSVTWKGDGVTNAWDTSTANWIIQSTGSATAFSSGDPVTFDDTGSANPAVNIDTAVSPGTMTFNTYANNYTLSGTGVIGGSGVLVKDGTASLTIEDSGANTYSGGAEINSGIAYTNNGSGFGSGPIALNGGDMEVISGATSVTVNNAINVNEASTLGITGGNIVFGGAVSGAAPLTMNFNSNHVVTLQNSWAACTGTLGIYGSGNLRLNYSTTWGFPNTDVNLDGAVTLYNRATNASVTIPLGALNGVSTSILAGSDQSSSAGYTATYVIGSLNLPSVFAGTIQNSTNETVAITTEGSSTFTLSGSGTYTGATSVSAGTFLLTGSLGNTALSVSSGATFIANGVVNGSVTLNTGGAIYLGNSTSSGVGTLTIGNGMTLASGTGASIYYDLSSSPTASGSNDEIIVTAGTLTMNGTTDFQINLANGVLGSGTYTLIGGSSTLSTGGVVYALDLPIPAGGVTRQTINLARPASGTTPAYVDLVVGGNAGALTWTGTNGATWDLDTTSDWSGASPATFYDLDQVTFNDMDTGGTVVLSGTLAPSVVNVSNSVTNYDFTGAGGLAGATELIKTGNASLTIAETGNTFTGPIYLDGGTLYGQAWLGTGTLYMNGGTLWLGGGGYDGYFGNSIVVNQTSTIFSSGNIYLLNNTGNTLTSANNSITLYLGFSGVFSFSNNITGFAGTIECGASTGLLRINGGLTNTCFGDAQALFDLGTSTATLDNRNGAITINIGALAGGPNTSLSGRQSGSAATTSTYVVGALNTNNTFAGSINNGGDQAGINLTKVGTGNWTLSGTSNFTGNMLVQLGTLTISGSDNNNGDDFETQSGATLSLAGGTVTTETVQIDSGAIFTGNGTINGDLVNHGAATISGSAALTVNGNYENDGTMTIDGGSTLVVNLPAGGSGFVNNGLLDIMDSPQTVLPSGYVNNGTILNSSLVTLKSFTKTGNSFSVTIQAYSGHTYQLQKSTDLNTWQSVGSSQAGAGSAIMLTDTNATTGSMFYQVAVGP
jgi:autotransporter-associated beta strand protein